MTTVLVLTSGTVITLFRQAALLGEARMFPFLHTWVTESIRRHSAEDLGATPELRASSSLSYLCTFPLCSDARPAALPADCIQPNAVGNSR